MPKNTEQQDRHSAPVQEILGTMPSWITRWGITIILLILIGVLVCGYLYLGKSLSL